MLVQKSKIYLLLFFVVLLPLFSFAQRTPQKVLEDTLTIFGKRYADVGNVRISRITPNASTKQLAINTNVSLSYLPLRPENVDSIYHLARSVMQAEYPDYTLSIVSDGRELTELIPAYYRKNEKKTYPRFSVTAPTHPLTRNLSRPLTIDRGLQNRHLAVWHSHGKFYNQSRQTWMWQRPILFSTVEDLHTQAYVLPFLAPMLENAGANVLIPRERDTQRHEVIIDNDKSSANAEFSTTGANPWKTGALPGFGHMNDTYKEKENPFTMGTYLQTRTTTDSTKLATVRWIPDIPQNGQYAVYVSYKTVGNSTRDARYSVKHAGGVTHFAVNQTMGGGTWIYLGHFEFAEGKKNNQGVYLSNFSTESEKTITADAVKVGGGMGNIARKPADKIVKRYVRTGRKRKKRLKTSVKKYTNYSVSHSPRFTEGARYWLQWAGVPDSVYSQTGGTNDYSDDFQSRGFWVNYLAGGSAVLPERAGLNIPIDMAFAFHTDAGARGNDSIMGTLAIYTIDNSDKKTVYANRVSRRNAREMADMIQTQITDDIRRSFNPSWNRRGLWNRSYSESRVPEVPTMLLEMLSHQNFQDMRYGHDPRFRFTVSRAIYKGILRYLAAANDFEYQIQPLPVQTFASELVAHDEVKLTWAPTPDPLEPTAMPDAYIVYTREGDGGFDNGTAVRSTVFTKKIEPGKIYSFKVEAVNRGGRSFPSEVLSVHRAMNNKPVVLIVNGFNRVSAPESFSDGQELAGFNETFDAGVPYLADIAYIGQQNEFRRNRPYVNNDNVGFGASNRDYEDRVISGNTFDYPFVHGKAIMASGFSFVSTSEKAVLNGTTRLHDYKIVNLILGKERQRHHPIDSTKKEFRTFEPEMQKAITQLTDSGGNILITGSNVVSDLVLADNSQANDKRFIEHTLRVKWAADKINNLNRATFAVSSSNTFFGHMKVHFHALPNEQSYFVEAPDIVWPADNSAAKTICRYEQSHSSAGIAYKGHYGMCVFGFPFETIETEKERFELMRRVLTFFTEK